MLCPYCQEEIKDEAIKCKHCKTELIPIAQKVDGHQIGTMMFPMSRAYYCVRLLIVIIVLWCLIYFTDFTNNIGDTVFQIVVYVALLFFVWIQFSICLYKGKSGVYIDCDNVSIYVPLIKSGFFIFKFKDIKQCILYKDKITISMEQSKLCITSSGSYNVNSIFLFSTFFEEKDTHFSLNIDKDMFSRAVFEALKQTILARGAEIGFSICDNSDMTLSDKVQKWSDENPIIMQIIQGALILGGMIAIRHFWR